MSRARLLLSVLAIALGALGGVSHPVAAAPAPSVVALLAGTYRYVGNWKQDEAEIQESIEEAVTSLGWLGRKIAASRLESHRKRPSRVVIAQAGEDLSITMGDYEAVGPLDGSKREVIAPNGRESKLSYRMTEAMILQFFVAEHAKRESTYSLDDQGRLIMTVYMTSEKLASPIAYEFTYEKVP